MMPRGKRQSKPTLSKVGLGVVGLHIGMGDVKATTNGNKVGKSRLELGVKLDDLGHGIIVQLMGKHDSTTLVKVFS